MGVRDKQPPYDLFDGMNEVIIPSILSGSFFGAWKYVLLVGSFNNNQYRTYNLNLKKCIYEVTDFYFQI